MFSFFSLNSNSSHVSHFEMNIMTIIEPFQNTLKTLRVFLM